MKPTVLLLTTVSTALAFSLASCTKEQEINGPAPQQLRARIEGSDTRVEIDDVSGKLAWTDGDEIAVHTTAGAYRTVSLDATGGFSLPLSPGEDRDGYAVYPAGIIGSGASLSLVFPETYVLDENNEMDGIRS